MRRLTFRWTPEEEHYLRKNAHKAVAKIAAELPIFNYVWRSKGAVDKKLRRMGLR